MRLLLLLFVSIFTLTTADIGVRELTPNLLKEVERETIYDKKYYFVLFYAPWCWHCRDYEPIYIATAKELTTKHAGLNFVKIDASRYRSSLLDYGIRGYPTIKLLIKGNYFRLRGNRTSKDLETFFLKTKQML